MASHDGFFREGPVRVQRSRYDSESNRLNSLAVLPPRGLGLGPVRVRRSGSLCTKNTGIYRGAVVVAARGVGVRPQEGMHRTTMNTASGCEKSCLTIFSPCNLVGDV